MTILRRPCRAGKEKKKNNHGTPYVLIREKPHVSSSLHGVSHIHTRDSVHSAIFETEYTGMGPIYSDRLLMSSMYIVHTCVVLCISVIECQYFQITQISRCRNTLYYLGGNAQNTKVIPRCGILYIPVPCPGLNLCRSPVKSGENMQVKRIDQ